MSALASAGFSASPLAALKVFTNFGREFVLSRTTATMRCLSSVRLRVTVHRSNRRGHPLRLAARAGLIRFLGDDRIELDTNIVERGISPIVLNRKNALFTDHDAGAEN